MYGYTGIRTYRTENFSPAQKQLTVCFVQSSVFGYTGFLIYRILNLRPTQSGMRAILTVINMIMHRRGSRS